jgi:hypothetical protein
MVKRERRSAMNTEQRDDLSVNAAPAHSVVVFEPTANYSHRHWWRLV